MRWNRLFHYYSLTLHYEYNYLLMKKSLLFIIIIFLSANSMAKIDRKALIERNCPHITALDTLASLSVGNGEFAFTCDVTGLQTFHNVYSHGVPLGTMAQWGWHSFPNNEGFKPEDALKPYDFGRGQEEWYSCQLKDERGKRASDYLRVNPHRLHLGVIGFEGIVPDDISNIDQKLQLWSGTIQSQFECNGTPMQVLTSCNPEKDMVVADITDSNRHNVLIKLPYPTGVHSDDACDWSEGKNHHVEFVSRTKDISIYRHVIDGQSYYIKIGGKNVGKIELGSNRIVISPKKAEWKLCVELANDMPDAKPLDADKSSQETANFWNSFWEEGGVIDFSHCTDGRAKELERRAVLSQYLLAIQCAGSTPPQETGLTYNSWFGKYHLEMIWWHEAQFALWGHPDMLERSLRWYEKALPMAKEIAKRQGFEGARWMKMTDPSAQEAPSNVGSFLIWQQPHLIYLCELVYRGLKSTNDEQKMQELLKRYSTLIEETATFMSSFATYDKDKDRYTLKGCIPAQETLKASDTVNPPFELSYWHYALSVAQQWRERQGIARNEKWDDMINKLSPLCEKDGVYCASENSPSYPSLIPEKTEGTTELEAQSIPENLRLYSDHMAVLAAYGVLPYSPQFRTSTMSATLRWVLDNWNWDKTWGWDFPTTCMTAVRTNEPEMAIEAILKNVRTNTYLPNGHNYQDSRLRCYLPGNGGLLTALALMTAGYDGCTTTVPGFPKDGTWNVEYEGICPMP